MPKPLKRHPALFPLSRQHHRMLVLAQLLKANAPAYRGLPTDPEGKRSYAIQCFQDFIQDHFIQEEQQLLPHIEFKNQELLDIATTMRSEHAALITQFASLLTKEEENLENELDRLGQDLESHIRKEERSWFMEIQRALTETELEALDFSFS